MEIVFGILALVLFIVSIVEARLIYRNLRKVETYEEWILMVQTRMKIAYDAIKAADIRGSFEADDEVGVAFRTIKSTLEELEKYTE